MKSDEAAAEYRALWAEFSLGVISNKTPREIYRTGDLVQANCTRCTAAAIEAYIATLLGP